MAKKILKSTAIKEGLFFKEDFKKLPKNAIIFIKSGKLLLEAKK